jgi:hypothetical protein
MSTSNSVAQVIAQTAAELDDAFEIADPAPSNVYFLHQRRPAMATPKTLAECVPLMTVAAEFIRRGPNDLSIAGVEAYRAKALELLANVKPVVERRAQLTFDEWAADMTAQPEIARSLT